jgi:DNA polymerase-1
MAKFLIVDGTALVFRGFYAIPHLSTSKGELINAVFGFYTILLNLLLSEKPSHLAICFDRREETQRKKEFKEYKAKRTKAPDELYAQIDPIKRVLTESHLNLVEKAGYEADDIIAALAKANDKDNIQVYIYSSDLDLIQLVNKIKIIRPGNAKTGNQIMDTNGVIKKYGFAPHFIPDFKGLNGDSSDNLQGIKGIGEKTACKLIQDFGHLEQIYENIDKIEGALKRKLIEGKEQAYFFRKLATLNTDIQINLDLEEYEVTKIELEKLEQNLKDFEFTKLVQKIPQLRTAIGTYKKMAPQQTLF